MDNIYIGERIGSGSFGTVYKVEYFGTVYKVEYFGTVYKVEYFDTFLHFRIDSFLCNEYVVFTRELTSYGNV